MCYNEITTFFMNMDNSLKVILRKKKTLFHKIYFEIQGHEGCDLKQPIRSQRHPYINLYEIKLGEILNLLWTISTPKIPIFFPGPHFFHYNVQQ
jgi:hypothetical protein